MYSVTPITARSPIALPIKHKTTSVTSGVTVVDAAALASGSVAYALGASFGQTIGTDTQPVHYDGTNAVYKDGDTYTNTAPSYAASVADKNGNAIGTYKTFSDAVTAAQASEDSVLTLLDNITLTAQQAITSGKFILDLNGKTLLCESGVVLNIFSGVTLTIKDSGTDGTVESKDSGSPAINNGGGTLTVESGTVKGDCGIQNLGTLTFNNGTVEAVTYEAIDNGGTAYVYDGVLKSENMSGIINKNGAELYVYGGEISGIHGINNNGTAYISGGEIKGNSKYALGLNSGTVEVTGGSFSGTDYKDGSYSGTSYGEYTVSYTEGATLTLKGGEFPNGFVTNGVAANTFLASGYAFYDKDGNKITVASDATKISGYVQVKESYAASVTDKNKNLIGKYKTFSEAVTAASASEDSVLTLLDNITLTAQQNIESGKFTLDLNGKTLLNESGDVLTITSGVTLTIKDSGTDGTVESKASGYYAIYNHGTLTVESGTVKGDGGIKNSGILYFNNGTVEAVTYEAIENYGTAYVYDGVVKSETANGILNKSGVELYVYGGEISGVYGIINDGTAYIEGGEIKGNSRSALCLNSGTVEVTGGSFSGTDYANGSYSGTPYGEWTVYYTDGATLTFKGGEFPNGFVTYGVAANTLLASGYAFYDKDGNKITVASDATVISGYVQVKEYFAASVTDKNGNAIGKYKTFAEAVTAASASEDSVLTLLDNVTLTSTQRITSGKFILDLNGKTLLNKSGIVLIINSGVTLTIKDSGTGGTVESKASGYYAINNAGTLTVESGTVKGAYGIKNNRGTLYFKNGTVEAVTDAAIYNIGTVYVYDGVLKSENWKAITNQSGGKLYIYDGEISGTYGIINGGTVYISGGEIKGNSNAAFILYGGTVEVTGGSFSGTDDEDGSYSGTPYGEYTVSYEEGATLTFTLKGGEFPNGFVTNGVAANTLLADEYYFRDTNGKLVSVADDVTEISGYVKVTKGADFETEAVVTLSATEFTYNGNACEPEVTVTVGGKALVKNTDYTVAYSNNIYAGTSTVTVSGTGVWSGKIEKEFTIKKADLSVATEPTANELTYNGKPQSLVTEGTADAGTVVYSLDGETYSETVPVGTDAKKYTVYYKVIGDTNYNDSTPAEITVTIGKKDISDGSVVLGDALIYNGTEQTQTVAEFSIPSGLDVTYNVSGNKATNVGVYQLTVSGEGNFKGEAMFTFEIAPDTSGIDAIDVDSVKSSDKAVIEAVRSQIDNAVTDLADDETKAEYKAISDKCDALLEKINTTAEELARIEEAVNAYDEATVTSEDIPELAKLAEDIAAISDSDNLTAEEQTALEEIKAAFNVLTEKLSEVAEKIEEVDNAVSSYDEDTVKSSDSEDLAQLKADAQALIDSANTSENEKNALEEMIGMIEVLEDKIAETAEEIERIENAVNGYDVETVKSSDAEALEQLAQDIKTLLDSDNLTSEEETALKDTKDKAESLLETVDDAAGATDTENTESVKDVTAENVTTENKTDLENAKADLEKALEEYGDNYTDDEKKAIGDEIKRIDDALDVIANVEAVEELISNIPENIQKDDEAAINEADDAYNALSDYEKSLVDPDILKELENAKEALIELKTREYALGDINMDGTVNQYDYILAKRAHFNTITLNENQKLIGDMDEDGDNDSYDYILIKRIHFDNYVTDKTVKIIVE